MGYKFHYNQNDSFSKLAWIATICQNSDTINVTHGSSVECRENFMVEGVWDDKFEKGNFHRSEIFFGSGIKIENETIHISISSTAIDRILYCKYKEQLFFSNSLVHLLAYTGAKLDINHDYKQESFSQCISINKNPYKREFTVIHPEIKNFYQVFHENIIINQGQIDFDYRYKSHKIASYNQCLKFLNNTLEKIRDNYESNERSVAFSKFTMLSTGYDSTAVSALIKEIGVKSAFIANRLKSNIQKISKDDESDGARIIAKQLGYEVLFLDNKESNISDDELYFLSTTFPKHHTKAWSELGLHLMAKYIEKNTSVAIVFSGHHGDTVWDAQNSNSEMKEIRVPHQPYGWCSEMRLKSGFIFFPLPGILSADIKDIAKITHSPEMEPWRLHNDYDRPIPRRIAEEAGVDRHLFGLEKNFIATIYYLPANSNLRKSFFKFLRSMNFIYPIKIYLHFIRNLLSKLSVIDGLRKRKFGSYYRVNRYLLGKDIDLYFIMTIWATNKLSERIARILSKGPMDGGVQ